MSHRRMTLAQLIASINTRLGSDLTFVQNNGGIEIYATDSDASSPSVSVIDTVQESVVQLGDDVIFGFGPLGEAGVEQDLSVLLTALLSGSFERTEGRRHVLTTVHADGIEIARSKTPRRR